MHEKSKMHIAIFFSLKFTMLQMMVSENDMKQKRT